MGNNDQVYKRAVLADCCNKTTRRVVQRRLTEDQIREGVEIASEVAGNKDGETCAVAAPNLEK